MKFFTGWGRVHAMVRVRGQVARTTAGGDAGATLSGGYVSGGALFQFSWNGETVKVRIRIASPSAARIHLLAGSLGCSGAWRWR